MPDTATTLKAHHEALPEQPPRQITMRPTMDGRGSGLTRPRSAFDARKGDLGPDWRPRGGRWPSRLGARVVGGRPRRYSSSSRATATTPTTPLITGALQLFRSLHPQNLHTAPIACRDVHHLLHLFYLSISFLAPTATPGDLRASTRREHVLPRSELAGAVRRELRRLVCCSGRGSAAPLASSTCASMAAPWRSRRCSSGDYSESMFRNLIAFEQTYPATPGHITAYASFMACLITTHEDMRLLHQSGILINHMSSGDRDATRFFSSISAQAHTSVDLNHLAGVKEGGRYQAGRWPRWRASLTRNYFSNSWVTTSVVAAVFLFCLTVVQTFLLPMPTCCP
ncbi:hypothetical protein ZWY2020_024601 [Hordeum vulgare]|nr:hypothetical protein ZWY2020_024601 [Hordeum vulgare]